MTPTVGGLVAALKQAALLEPEQLAEVERLARDLPDVVDLSRELIRRKWVTLYQLKQLFLGKGNNLVLGPYVVLDLLGAGGMGQVFKARHRKLDRIDALKVIRADHVAQPGVAARFQREARAAARLNHKNIVSIYTIDEIAGTHFIAMEFVEGVDLARIAKTVGPLNVGQATDYVQQVASGLQHAHEKGLVHRDIKPANLLVTADAVTVKILDMGLARLLNLEEDESKTALTQTGVVMGTPDFMAPEQALDSSTVDIRADIYSLGCTLYFLLCGAPPFPIGSLTQKLLWHQQREPEPLEKKRPDLPPELLVVVWKMMAKDPAERYTTPAEVAHALEPFVHLDIPVPEGDLCGNTLAPGEVRPSLGNHLDLSFSQKPTVAVEELDFSFCLESAGLVGELSGFTPGLGVGSQGPEVSTTDALLTPATNSGTEAMVPGGDDATEVQVRKKRPEPRDNVKHRPERKAAEGDEPEEEEGTNWYTIIGILGFLVAAVALFWPQIASLFAGRGSPDGPKTPETKLELKRIDHTAEVWSGAFLPDGQRAATGSGTTVFISDLASGTTIRKLEKFPGKVLALACSGLRDFLAAGCVAGGPETVPTLSTWTLQGNGTGIDTRLTIMALALSPDDQYVVAAGGRTAPGENAVLFWDVNTSKLQQTFVGHKDFVKCVAFSHDSRRVASCSLDSTIAVWDLASPKAALTQKFEHRILALAFLKDDKELVLGGENNTLGVYNLAGKKWADPSGFQGHTNDVTCVAVSPDGTRLLSGSGDKTVRLWDIATRQQLALLEGHTHRDQRNLQPRRQACPIDQPGPDGAPVATAVRTFRWTNAGESCWWSWGPAWARPCSERSSAA
jgi:serine/threonine-protein kinase